MPKKPTSEWVRSDYEKFVRKVTKSWPQWKKDYLTT